MIPNIEVDAARAFGHLKNQVAEQAGDIAVLQAALDQARLDNGRLVQEAAILKLKLVDLEAEVSCQPVRPKARRKSAR